MKISEFLIREAFLTDLQATHRDEALREIVRAVLGVVEIPGQSVEDLTGVLLSREDLGSTGIGRGVAIPHARVPSLDRLLGSVALAPGGVEFAALDGEPVNVFVLLLSPQESRRESISACEATVRLIQDDVFLTRLRHCRTRDDILELFLDAERGGEPPARRGT